MATQPPYIPTGGPNDPPINPLMHLLSQMPPEMLLGMVNGRLRQDQGQPATTGPQAPPPVVQPDLDRVSELQRLRHICENLEKEVNHLKRIQEDDNDDGDDEGDREQNAARPKKKKKSMKDKERTYLLNRPLQDLSPAEKTTREELQKCLDDAIFDVTGISMDTIEDNDSNDQDSALRILAYRCKLRRRILLDLDLKGINFKTKVTAMMSNVTH
ncbi:hypothetical protein P692DRAFT_201871655 [Suillus brevipes Sb2]|nr:hypothetical protein P692DRAFT_201871655 [Suillus brevipes Sb2]